MDIKKLQNILTAIKRTFVGFVIFAPLSIIDDKYNYGDLFDPLNSLLSYVLPYVETTTGEFVICIFFCLLLTFFFLCNRLFSFIYHKGMQIKTNKHTDIVVRKFI